MTWCKDDDDDDDDDDDWKMMKIIMMMMRENSIRWERVDRYLNPLCAWLHCRCLHVRRSSEARAR